MKNLYEWFSKKDNIKILVMAGLAVVLIFVLKHRFYGAQTADTVSSLSADHDNRTVPQPRSARQSYDNTGLKSSPENSKTAEFDNLTPPSFLTRDIFSFSNTFTNHPNETEETAQINLELKATIIDDRDPLAIIGEDVVRVGEFVNGFEVTAIKNNEVILSKSGKHYILNINSASSKLEIESKKFVPHDRAETYKHDDVTTSVTRAGKDLEKTDTAVTEYGPQEIYTIQTGSFTKVQNASRQYDAIVKTLNGEDLDYLRIEKIGRFYVVRLRQFNDYQTAKQFLQDRPQLSSAMLLKGIRKRSTIKQYNGTKTADHNKLQTAHENKREEHKNFEYAQKGIKNEN